MALFKCKMCGGDLAIEEGSSIAVCEYCGSKQTLPKLDDERRLNLYDRANHFRRNNEFDKAMGIYEQILNEDSSDAEAYWSIVLCRYGIEYVEDPATKRRVPTVNRAQFTSIFADEDYKAAIAHADPLQRSIYEDEAQEIDGIQKGILAISQKEEPFDVFICYKETDNNGRRTPDSVLANDLYHQLTNEGYKVFFSRITLEDKLGTAYEPYIFAALNSAKVMVVLGTKPEYFNAVWVKNEWSRYLALVKQSGGEKVLIPAYRDMDPYDLPDEFSHLQAQDMSKLGFMQDLIRGIKKIVPLGNNMQAAKPSSVDGKGTSNTAPLLRRAFLSLEDGDWAKADDFCEQVLNIEPENAQAYLGKLMAELHIHKQEELRNCKQPFDRSNNYQKAVRFGDNSLSNELAGITVDISERNKQSQLESTYDTAVAYLNAATNEMGYKAAADIFKRIVGFKNADDLAKQCIENAEACRKDAVYSAAIASMNEESIITCESAIKKLESIRGWRDAEEQIKSCKRRMMELEEKWRVKAEQERKTAIKADKRRKAKKMIVAFAAISLFAAIIVASVIAVSSIKNSNASALEQVKTGIVGKTLSAHDTHTGSSFPFYTYHEYWKLVFTDENTVEYYYMQKIGPAKDGEGPTYRGSYGYTISRSTFGSYSVKINGTEFKLHVNSSNEPTGLSIDK